MVRILNRSSLTEFDFDTMRYIGRGTPYGNPYKVGIHGKRDHVIRMFERDILPGLNVERLRGFDLVCHCAPEACHGHSIYRKLYGKEYNET